MPEPFAGALWHTEIAPLAAGQEDFLWTRATPFSGLYQRMVASRIWPAPEGGDRDE